MNAWPHRPAPGMNRKGRYSILNKLGRRACSRERLGGVGAADEGGELEYELLDEKAMASEDWAMALGMVIEANMMACFERLKSNECKVQQKTSYRKGGEQLSKKRLTILQGCVNEGSTDEKWRNFRRMAVKDDGCARTDTEENKRITRQDDKCVGEATPLEGKMEM